jgi:hypothetical protein
MRLVSQRYHRQYTGDVLGATNELNEALVLLLAFVVQCRREAGPTEIFA